MSENLIQLLLVFAVVFLSYFVGTFQSSYLLGKAVYKKDVRDYGSHNAGATNAIRVFGLKFGMLCLLLDALKGALAVLLTKAIVSGHVTSEPSRIVLLELICGLITVLGHNHPFYMGFKGGKGVAATIGVMFAIDWRIALIAGVPALLIMVAFRFMSVASLTFETLCFLCFTIFYFGTPESYLIAIGALYYPVISFYRHKENIKRLASGEEPRLWGKGSKKDLARKAAEAPAEEASEE